MLSMKKKTILLTVLSIFIFVTSATVLFKPEAAHAQLVTMEAESVPQKLKQVLDKVYEGLKIAVINAVVNFLEYFMQKIAYDAAVYLASGGQGQTPLIFTEDPGTYFKNTVDEAAGKAIEAFSEVSGLNLCEIPDINLDLSLKVGLRSQYGPPAQPTCTFTAMIENWGDEEAWKSKYGSYADKLDPAKVFASSLSVDESDLGITMNAKAGIDRLQAEKKEAAELERTEGQGAKPIKDIISGDTKTPSQVVKKQIEDSSPSEKNKDASVNFGSVLGAGTWQVIPSTLSTFFNTLISNGLKNVLSGGMFPSSDETVADSTVYSYTDASSGGRRRAEQIFSSILIPDIKPVNQYNILSHMANCPQTPGIYNCTIDSGFSGAVQQAKLAKPLTIKEAISKGYLNDSWKLIPPSDPALDTSKTCYTKAYCHANIKKLRQTGILSLGFELAAKNSNPDKPWTLKQVVDGFNDCNYAKDGITVVPDPKNKPFCHLIDPEWVLTIAETRCNALGYTNNLVDPASSDRQQECVDLSTCVAKDTKGACIAYGYCTRSKNTWRIDGSKCDAQNSTCISYKDSNDKIVSYLYSTLDTQSCSAKNVGCNLFSLSSAPTASSSQNWVGFGKGDLNNLKNDIVSPAIFFNKNASSKCTSAGCNKYLPGNSLYGSSPFYLKKAPDYLGCYDSDLDIIGIQWPKSTADLKKIKGHADCDDYAQVCIPEEENCSLYTQATTNDIIPGKFKPAGYVTQNSKSVYKWNDQCHSTCDGYDAYREMSSSYSGGQSLAYIIPSTVAACTSQQSGCSGFTNLATTTGGIEQIEYYTYLRPCIKPNTALQKTFYTYEGGTHSGFQLKVYVLEINPLNSSKGPKYYRTAKEKSDHNAVCNETLYKAKIKPLSQDCRQFTDSDGKAFYVKLADTIVVDKSCSPYRLNKTETFKDSAVSQSECTTLQGRWDGTSCNLCFNDGFYKDGNCYYNGLPNGKTNSGGNSLSCTKAVDSCRPYKGNSANNIQKVFLNSGANSTIDDFENGNIKTDMENWDCTPKTKVDLGNKCKLGLSNESTRADEHSLGMSVTKDLALFAMEKKISITPGNSYTVSFWMKSDASRRVTVQFADSGPVAGYIAVSDVWQYYKLGPIEIPKSLNSATETLRFALGNTRGAMYIDNLQITKINNLTYLVKDKISVPTACDLNQKDNLPGEALGCTKYTAGTTVTNQNTYYLTGFNYLCREKAIGCIPLLDTFNKDISNKTTANKTKADLYNVWLTGASGKKAKATVDGVEYSCQVKSGDTGCYVNNIPGYSPKNIVKIKKASNIKITTSTVYLPADTPTSSPVYLVVDKSSSCNSAEMGCSYIGKQTMTINGPKYESVLLLNNPALYSKNLCQEEGMGCGTYSSSEGNLYFKDPAITGQKICKYQKSVTLNGANYKGWFWKGVGNCGTTTAKGTKTIDPKVTTNCSSDTDCSKNKTGYTSCINKDTLPCYPNLIQNQNEYGIWPFGNKKQYNGFVGECPSTQSGCTEYRDPSDNDKSYYLLNNDKITTDKQDCTSGVSSKTGCILFNQTDLPNKTYSSKLTYAASKAKDYIAVTPIASTTLAGNDSNMVMKVIRDRECGEWLSCRTGESVWDSINSQWNKKCDIIGRCNAAVTAGSNKSASDCANPIDSHSLSDKILTEDYYKRRKIDWDSMDYVGYSILDLYPIEELRQVNFGTTKVPDYRLAKYLITKIDCATNTPNGISGGSIGGCTDGVINGKCIAPGVCIIGPKGGVTTKSVKKESPKRGCRSYPAKDAPYPKTAEAEKSSVYQNANFCDESYVGGDKGVYDCECQYTKYQYGDNLFTKFWKYDPLSITEDKTTYKKLVVDSKITKVEDLYGVSQPGKKTETSTGTPAGICYNAGSYNGYGCKNDDECRDYTTIDKTGICMKQKKADNNAGWFGYCVEEDRSRLLYGQNDRFQCLSWYPIDNILGTFDISSEPRSGYVTANGYYCREGRGNYFGGDQSGFYKPIQKNDGAYTKFVDSSWFVNEDYTESKKTFTDKSFNIKDIDYVVLRVQNSESKKYDGAIIKDGYYLIRNGSAVNITSKVATLYGKDEGFDPASGCAVYEADDNTYGQKVSGSTKLTKQDCYNKKDKFFFSPSSNYPLSGSLNIEASVNYSAVNADSGENVQGETRVYTNSGNTIMRAFFDDRQTDNCGLACSATKRSYIANREGFFPDIGDKNGYSSGSSWETKRKWCDNGTEHQQNTLEVYLKFDKNGWLIERGVAACSAGQSASDDFGMILDIFVVTREYCTQIADVAGKNKNTAYTNNVWKTVYNNDRGILGNLSEFNDSTNFSKLGYKDLVVFAPRKDVIEATGYLYDCSDGLTSPTDLNKRYCGGYDDGSYMTGLEYKKMNGLTSVGDFLGKTLFARSNRLFDLKITNSSFGPTYTEISKSPGSNFDYTEDTIDKVQGIYRAPRLRAVLTDNCISGSKEKCKEGKDDTLTINSKTGGDVLIQTSPGVATLKFYMLADKNQMPITQIQVDWDDGNPLIPKLGMFANYRGIEDGKCVKSGSSSKKTCYTTSDDYDTNSATKGYPTGSSGYDTEISCETDKDCEETTICSQSDSTAPTFSRTPNACKSNYMRFTNTYSCDKSSNNYQSKCTEKSSVQGKFPNGCCIFYPRVQVKDNWGWYNSSEYKCSKIPPLYSSSPGGDGCYDGFKKGEINEGTEDKVGPWTSTSTIRVIVAPK